MVIGGAEVFRAAYSIASRAYFSLIEVAVGELPGAVRLPPFPADWDELPGTRVRHPADRANAYAFDTMIVGRARRLPP